MHDIYLYDIGPSLPLPKGIMIDSPARSPLLPVFTQDSLSGWMSPIRSLDSFPLSDSRSTLQSGTQNTDIRYDPLSPMDPETNVFTLLSSADRQALAFYADPILPSPVDDEFRGGSLPLFIRNYPEPFSWAKNSDWSILQKAMHAYQEIMKLPGTSTENLNAILYPELGQIAAYSGHCADSSFPKLLFFSILNGTAFPREIPLDKVSRWFRSTSPYSMMLFLESVPAPFSDVLAEQIFQVAIEVGDAHIIDEILQRGLNPNESIYENGKVTPLERAISLGHFEATKMLLRHITNTRLYFTPGELLIHIVRWSRFSGDQSTELVCLLLHTGEIPGLEVVREAYNRPDILKILIAHEDRIASCLRWLRAGILKDSIQNWHYRYSDFDNIATEWNCTKWIMDYFLRENIQDLPAGNPDVSLALSEALSAAIQSSWYWAAEIILDASFSLETHVPLEISDPSFGSILSYAYQQGNKELVYRLIKIVEEPQVQRLETLGGATNVGTDDASKSEEDEESEHRFSILRPEVKADFCNAISNGNFDMVHRFLNFYENGLGLYEQQNLLRTILETIDLSDEQALTRILGTLKLKNDIMESVYINQLRNRVEPISALLFYDSLLANAVPLAIDQGDFSMLENLIFRRCLDQNESFLVDAIKYRGDQLVFRGLLYYGIQHENFSFMKWLIDAGAHLGELFFGSCNSAYLHTGVLHTHPTCGINFWPSEDVLLHVSQDASQDGLPSLLEVAVGRNNKSLIKFLLAEGADGHDSFALRTAVILGHGSELLTMLMDASENARPQNRRHYGSSALREAIHTRNADSVRLLAGRVDINGFEPGVHGWRSTPLGEAIKTYEDNGIETVRLLLKNGGDPDTLVTYDGFRDKSDESFKKSFEKSFLGRMTAMLAAIDTNHLPMVQLLVDHGADVNLPPKFGVTRTPLQRAAERKFRYLTVPFGERCRS